jgi:HAE1 family hydrophobic/amphiphilic exporter-1
VIWLFLGDPRTSLVPAMAIPIALVGSLAAVWMLGYSINVLTLLALVLATGLVVDEAIVVLEAIKRRHAEGLAPLQAAAEGTSEVVFAVLATTAVLGAVFAPLAFLPGEIGMVLREFAVTLAVAAALSTLVALTLAPVLAARVLRAAPAERRAPGPLARAGAALARGYGIVVGWITAAPWLVLLAAAGVTVASVLALTDLKRGFLPIEDRGELRVYVTLPPGSTLDLTETHMREVEARLAPLLASGEAVALMIEVGAGGRAERGHATLALAPHAARRPQAEILAEITARLEGLTGANIRTRIKGGLKLGSGGGGADRLSLAVLAETHDGAADMAVRLAARLAEDPAFSRAEADHDPSEPQIVIEIDHARASRFGVDRGAIGSVLRAASDGQSLGTVMLGGRLLPAVLLPPPGRGIDGPGSLGLVLLPAAQGHAVTLAELAEITERRGARELVRIEGRASVQIDARLAPGTDPAAALTRARARADELLPQDMRLALVGATADMQRSERSLMVAAGFALLLVFMVLAAQFESLRAATAIMATVPLGLALVALGLVAAGIEFNLYAQIGTLLLVGLLAKNAILIVDAAEVKLARGTGARQAVIEASAQRFRPVMMTLVSTLLGALPLALATGPGAEARVSVGLVVVGGLGLSAVATLVLTPATWLVLSRRAQGGQGQRVPRAA